MAVKKGKPSFNSPTGRLSFPALWEPNELSGKYEATLIFDTEEDVAPLRKIVQETAKEKWGNKIPATFHDPVQPGRENRPEEAGKFRVVFRTARGNRIGVCDRERNELEKDSPLIYGGCRARVNFTPNAYSGSSIGAGVNFWLNGVQQMGDDEPFGADPNVINRFDDLDTEFAEDIFN